MDDERSPIQLHLVLHRIDPEQSIRRFYSLMIEWDLFGTVRHWGWIGTQGQELVEVFASEAEAGQARTTLRAARGQRREPVKGSSAAGAGSTDGCRAISVRATSGAANRDKLSWFHQACQRRRRASVLSCKADARKNHLFVRTGAKTFSDI